MAGFLVEFRLQGFAKKYAKWARARAHREARRLGIKELKGRRPVSHITLFGSAETHNLLQVIREVRRIGSKYTLIPFKINGLSYFNHPNKKVIYLDVDPSLEFEQFRYELAQSLLKVSANHKPYDLGRKYSFHSTIGEFITSNDSKFEELYNCIETKCSLKTFKQCKVSSFGRLLNIVKKHIFRVEEDDPSINLHLLRVTVLGKGSRIQCEYDLVLKRLLTRREALSKYWWRKTINKLRELKGLPRGGSLH